MSEKQLEYINQFQPVTAMSTTDSKNFVAPIKWNKILNTAGPTPKPRHGHRAVSIKDLMIVYGGGNDGIVDDLHVYNTATNQWFVPAVRGDVSPGCAAFGMVCDSFRIFIFGGMVEFGKYSNDIFELQTKRWEWRQLRPRPPATGHPPPCPRLGHSFTITSDQICYVFGGLAHDHSDAKFQSSPIYLNDLYAIDMKVLPMNMQWEYLTTQGPTPSPRESHSAVFFEANGRRELIIYGGMSGARLGDLWILDLLSLTWINPVIHGIPPLPRSLHTANVIANKMYVFGGWVPMEGNGDEKEWRCSNSISVLNLETFTWEQNFEDVGAENSDAVPCARAGHSSVVINKRVYIWSGRDGYKKVLNSQVCCKDMFYLETDTPPAPGPVQLVRATIRGLELSWQGSTVADSYLLQVQKCEPSDELSPIGPRPVARLSGGTPGSGPPPHVRMVAQRSGGGMSQQVMKVMRSSNGSVQPQPAILQPGGAHRPPQQVVRVVQQGGGRMAIHQPQPGGQPPVEPVGGQRLYINQKAPAHVPPHDPYHHGVQPHGQPRHVGEPGLPQSAESQPMASKVVFVQPQTGAQGYGSGHPQSTTAAQLAGQSQQVSSYMYQPQQHQTPILYQQERNHGQFEPAAGHMEFAPIQSAPAEPKTTYTIPSISAIDQTMPHNILDEALNDAENYECHSDYPNVADNGGQRVDTTLTEEPKAEEKHKIDEQAQQHSALASSASGEQQLTTEQPHVPIVSDPQSCTSSVGDGDVLPEIPSNDDVKVEEESVDNTDSTSTSEVKNEVTPEEIKSEESSVAPVAQLSQDEPTLAESGECIEKKEEIEEPKAEDSSSVMDAQDAQPLPTSTQQEAPQTQSIDQPAVPLSATNGGGPVAVVNNGQPIGDTSESPSASSGYEKAIDGDQPQHSTMVAESSYVQPNDTAAPQRPPLPSQNIWYDVGVFKTPNSIVSHFIMPYAHGDGVDPIEDNEGRNVELEPGTYYRFRVAAINSCGRGPFSPVVNFKTCIPGFPGAPSSIKISKGLEGAQLSWEPPASINGRIVEYSVYLAVRNYNQESHLSFVRVYVGIESRCIVPHQNLQMAHVDSSPKPAIIFRIAAKNEKGYGPATQVRWLQDARSLNPAGGPPLAGGTPHRSNVGGAPPQSGHAVPYFMSKRMRLE